jgi:hypothetical protein
MVKAVAVVGVAALGSAHARSVNYQHQRFPSGYAGTVYLQAPRDANYHDYRPWATTSAVHPGYSGPVAASADAHRDGYDGGRYWWGGECWPTDPGGCDWQ